MLCIRLSRLGAFVPATTAAFFIAGWGCGGDAASKGDVAVEDTGVVITDVADTADTVDTAEPDTSQPDTTEPDTVPPDTHEQDTHTPPDITEPCEGELGCGCDDDAPCDGALVCREGECATCEPGWLDCACGDDDACEDNALCTAELCVDCPAGSETCGCRAVGSPGGVCDSGLACLSGHCVDGDCTLGAPGCPCRADKTCSGSAVCSGGICQGCAAGTLGCTCLAGACESGQFCAPNNACAALTATCDTSVAGSVGATCATTNRVCDTNAATGIGQCGACLSGFVHQSGPGSACRAVVTCADLSCSGVGQACTAHTTSADATCGCASGYVPEGNGCRVGASCDSLGCATQNRTCVAQAGAEAVCTTCLSGYVDVSGTCQPNCTTLGCAGDGRACSTPAGAAPSCGACLSGWVPHTEGHCVDLQTCSELNGGAGCSSGQTCIEANGNTGANATCQAGSGCGIAQALRPPNVCVDCDECDGIADSSGAAGGNHANVSSYLACVCHTQPGYFVTDDQFHYVTACDADNDGWVRRSYIQSRDSLDAQVRSEARCDVRKVDRFLLVPDERGGKPLVVLVSDLGLQAAQGVRTEGGVQFVELVEPDPLDNDATLLQAHTSTGLTAQHTMLHAYGEFDTSLRVQLIDGEVEDLPGSPSQRPARRRFVASELNPLTKFCHQRDDDYNWNGVPDTSEFHLSQVDLDNVWMTPFVRMSYFGELNRGFYVPPNGNYLADCEGIRWNGTAWVTYPCVGSTYGTYVIREKDRSLGAPESLRLELASPVNEPISALAKYGPPSNPDSSDANYWRECRRNRDSVFSASATQPDGSTAAQQQNRRNLDFARFSCPATAQGPCLASTNNLRTIDRSVRFDGRRPVGPRVSSLAADPGFWFAGMNHHSQFRCMQPRTPSTTTPPFDPARQIMIAELEPVATSKYHLLECGLGGSQESARDLAPDGSVTNPRDPNIVCRVDTSREPAQNNGDVHHFKWVVSRFHPYGRTEQTNASGVVIQTFPAYQRGCIDESVDWPFLCDGFNPEPFVNRANPTGDAGNFGHIQCGCGQSGGSRCEVGCGTTPFEQVDPPYNQTSRAGYWMCGEFSLVTPVYNPADFAGMTPNQLPAGLVTFEAPLPSGGPSGTWTLRSQIGLDPVINSPTKTCATMTSGGRTGDICVTP